MLYEKRKRYIRTLKTLHPNIENLLSEFKDVLDVIRETFYWALLQLWKILQKTLYPVCVKSGTRYSFIK